MERFTLPPLTLVDSGPVMPGLYEGILSAIEGAGLEGHLEILIENGRIIKDILHVEGR